MPPVSSAGVSVPSRAAAVTSLGFAWSGTSALCVVLVLGGALAVRPFWTYDASAPARPGG